LNKKPEEYVQNQNLGPSAAKKQKISKKPQPASSEVPITFVPHARQNIVNYVNNN